MATAGRPWRVRALISLVAAATLAVAGCSSQNDESGAASGTGTSGRDFSLDSNAAPGVGKQPGQAAPDKAAGGNAGKEAAGGPATGSGARTETGYASAQRQIIYTGTMLIRVDDVGLAATRLIQRTQAAGGFVGADRRSGDKGHQTAELTLRVPADKFSAFAEQAGTDGTVLDRDLSANDVSKQIRDLDARLLAARASVERVRALLARAESISDITAIEAELAKREGDLESLQAQKNSLADQTSFSTLTIRLVAKGVPVAEPDRDSGFLAGLKSGWRAFTAFMRGLLTVLGALLPFLALAAVVGVPVWWLLRRRRTAPGHPAAAPAHGGSAAPAHGGSAAPAETGTSVGPAPQHPPAEPAAR